MKKALLILFCITCFIIDVSAQYVDQALLFSEQYFGSTARSKAMGNAFGALGGDFSSLSINPAGIAIYRNSEISLSATAPTLANIMTTYQGLTIDNKSTDFRLRNFGYVFANSSDKDKLRPISFNFGIGFNRLNNFNRNINTQAINSSYSRSDAFAWNANGIVSSEFFVENDPYNHVPWESKLAWETYLINVANPDTNGIGDQYVSFLHAGDKVNQYEVANLEGYINEYPLSVGANINHRFYLGATIGLQDLYYSETRNYRETGYFGNFEYLTNASTRGFGYNVKLGVIYRPTGALRVGVAVHTPTYYSFKESFSAEMSSNLHNVSADADGSHSEKSPQGNNRYKMNSPFRMILSMAYIFGSKGLISFDYEFANYSGVKLHSGSDGYEFAYENDSIASSYNPVSNFRIGGEYKATEALSLRAGVEIFGNPYKTNINLVSQPNKSFNFNTINAGLGYRIENVFFDISYSLGIKTNYSYLYHVYQNTHGYENDALNIIDIADPVKDHSLIHELVFTIGMKL